MRRCSCSHQFAFEYGTNLVTSSPQALHDALNLGNCSSLLDASTLAANRAVLARSPAVRGELAAAAGTTLYVAKTGSDTTGTGTEAKPFASLHAAAAAISKAGGGTVLVRAGKYYMDNTLSLGEGDSNVRWAAYRGERVILSGGKLLKSLDWKPYKDKIMVATVEPTSSHMETGGDSKPNALLSEQERAYLQRPAARTPPGHNFGAPPAKWNTLHVDGVRQVRARFPNGDPQQGSGICFSKANRAGEGCAGYLAARGGLGCVFDPAGHNRMDNCTSLPDTGKTSSVSFNLDRGKAPKTGCKSQCSSYGTFKYTIYDPPAGHPVYNRPMPGLGWTNNPLLSFWGSP